MALDKNYNRVSQSGIDLREYRKVYEMNIESEITLDKTLTDITERWDVIIQVERFAENDTAGAELRLDNGHGYHYFREESMDGSSNTNSGLDHFRLIDTNSSPDGYGVSAMFRGLPPVYNSYRIGIKGDAHIPAFGSSEKWLNIGSQRRNGPFTGNPRLYTNVPVYIGRIVVWERV